MTLKERLCKYCRDQKRSLSFVANESGTVYITLYHWYSGRRGLNGKNRTQLSNYLERVGY